MIHLANIEFYSTPDGDVMYKIDGQPVRELSESSRDIIEAFLAVLRNRYPTTFARLSEMYSRYDRNRIHYEYAMVHRFIRCNFGEYDQNRFDIDSRGVFRFEEVKCPLRGECKHEGVICKPKMDTKLTNREKEVLRLIGERLDGMEIAKMLHISPSTVARHRENLKHKLGLRNVKDIVSYYITHIKD